jgi:hypothetical protein
MNKKHIASLSLAAILVAGALAIAEAPKQPVAPPPLDPRIDRLLEQNEKILKTQDEILKKLDEIDKGLLQVRRRTS